MIKELLKCDAYGYYIFWSGPQDEQSLCKDKVGELSKIILVPNQTLYVDKQFTLSTGNVKLQVTMLTIYR